MLRNPSSSRGSDSSGSRKRETTCKSCNISSVTTPKYQTQKCRKESNSLLTGMLLNNKKISTSAQKKTIKSDQSMSQIGSYNRHGLNICKICGGDIARTTLEFGNEQLNSCKIYEMNLGNACRYKIDGYTTKNNGKTTNNGQVKQNVARNNSLTNTQAPSNQAQVSNKLPFNKKNIIFDSSSMEDALNKIKLLDTITEFPETQTVVENSSANDTDVFKIYSDTSDKSNSASDERNFDAGDAEALRRIKEFRDRNYYECHSPTTIRNNGSDPIFGEHKDVNSLKMMQKPTPKNKFTLSSSPIGCVKSVSTGISGKFKITKSSKILSTNQKQNCGRESKSLSTGISLNKTKNPTTIPTKSRISDLNLSRKPSYNNNRLEICTKCGNDGTIIPKRLENLQQNSRLISTESSVKKICGNISYDTKTTQTNGKHIRKLLNNIQTKQDIHKNKSIATSTVSSKQHQSLSIKQPETVKQFYKNENFKNVSEFSIMEDTVRNEKVLDTILEVPEISTIVEDSSSEDGEFFKIYSQACHYIGSKSESENGSHETSDFDYLKRITDFRDTNFFECKSSKTRLRCKESVTSLGDHKCVYRFYLNERLFPEPLDSDPKRQVRCVDCHLPLELDDTAKDTGKTDWNATIQAKLKIGPKDHTQDAIVMLPVNKSLIIREKRKEPKRVSEEEIYFGVINIGQDGLSVFKDNFKSDSLALKYQRGYRELEKEEVLRYENVPEGEVIIV